MPGPPQCSGYDSAGAHVSVTRTVEVGCEDPNPGGTYGGNRVACSTIYKEMHGAAPVRFSWCAAVVLTGSDS